MGKPNNSPEITERKRQDGKDLGGRPLFQVDYKKLEKLCGYFNPGEDCAAILGCSYQTLNNRLRDDFIEATTNYENDPSEENAQLLAKRADGFREYFGRFSAHGRMTLRRKQFLKSLKGEGDTGMLKHLGKNYLGQSDRVDHTSGGEKISNDFIQTVVILPAKDPDA